MIPIKQYDFVLLLFQLYWSVFHEVYFNHNFGTNHYFHIIQNASICNITIMDDY